MKVLIPVYNVDEYRKWGEKGFIDVVGTYKIGLKITKLFKIVPILKRPVFHKYFLNDWKMMLKNYDMVLIWADSLAPFLCSTIHFLAPELRIVVYYTNCCALEVSPDRFNRNYCELWSFDSEDCKKYNMKYNPICVLWAETDRLSKDQSESILQDICFLGRDKNRLSEILDLKEVFENKGLKCDFYIVKSKGRKTKKSLKAKAFLKNETMSYEDYVKMIKSSKAVLDYNVPEQSGISQRPLEALYSSKKLITNNAFIKEYNFYNKDNIFVLGIDDFEMLEGFLNTPYVLATEEIIQYYNVKSWIDRFC